MKTICSSCEKPKAQLQCGLCEVDLCKNCTVFLEEDYFSFLPQIPKELTQTAFCQTCYQQKIIPQIEAYDQDMLRAQDIIVFAKNQGKETRFVKRLEDPFTVTDCLDEKDVTMRLAFLAVRAQFNALVDLVVTSTKIRNGSYQKLVWQGTAIPAQVDESKLPKDKSFSHS
jgi:hypothetical protein